MVLAPLGFLKYAILPLAVFASFLSIQEWYPMQAQFGRVMLSMSFIQGILLGLFTNNLLSKVMLGIAMSAHGIPARQFGIRLMLGFIPRFYVQRSQIRELNLVGQRACYAVPLLTKLALYGIGIVMWSMIRRSGTGASDAFLALGMVGFSGFLFTANPLFPADGQRWLAAVLRRPNIRRQSFQVLGMVLRRRPLPAAMNRAEAWAMAIYAIASVGFTAFLLYMIMSAVAVGLEAQFHGAGVVLFSILLAMLALFLVSMLQQKPSAAAKARANPKGGPTSGAGTGATKTAAARVSEPRLSRAVGPPSSKADRADATEMNRNVTGMPAEPAEQSDEQSSLGDLFQEVVPELIVTRSSDGPGEHDPDSFSDIGPPTNEELDRDSFMNELESLLAPASEAGAGDDSGPVEVDALEALLSADIEEVELDSDPVMSELESLLAPASEAGPAEESGPAEADALEALLSADIEEVELDSDPVMSELESLLAPASEAGAGDDSGPAEVDALEALLSADIEEAELDGDPVMSELGSLLAPVPDAVGAPDLKDAEDLGRLLDDSIVDAELESAPIISELESLLAPLEADKDAEADSDMASPAIEDGDEMASLLAAELGLEWDSDIDPGLDEMEALAPASGKARNRELVAASVGAAGAVVRSPDRAPAMRKSKTVPARQGSGYDDLDLVLGRTGVARAPRRKWPARLFWLAVLAGLVYVAFLPYSYEVGGDFIVEPIEQAQVRARTAGEITQVFVSEGDWVRENQIMAVMSNWDKVRDIAVRRAELNGLRADLETLMAGPRPEAIAMAQEAIQAADVQIGIAKQDLERKQKLFDRGTITATALENAQNALKVAEAQKNEALAARDLASAGALESEIKAAKADIERNEKDLEYAELQLEQTRIRAVTDGQIVSSLDTVPVGAFLNQGDLFAVLENNRELVAQIEVPETDIGDVKLGAKVELKTWSEADSSVWGEVYRIAPRADTRDFGRIVRVSVKVPNPDGALSSNMTGYAKVAAGEAPVWEVFSRVIQRFFQVELWSWIP